MHYPQRPQRGFTLIELMITVAIVGILTAIAYPAYSKYVQRGNRAEGIVMLNEAVARMERYYAQNNNYAPADLTTLGFPSTTPTSTTGKYLLKISSSSATAYTFQVVPQGTQATDTCGSLTVAQDGTRTPDPSTSTCWK